MVSVQRREEFTETAGREKIMTQLGGVVRKKRWWTGVGPDLGTQESWEWM